MVQSFSVNSDNDIYIGSDSNLAIATGIEGVLFACAAAAKAQLQEMIFAYNQGVANFQTIWRNSANVAQFEASVRAALSAVPGVIGIKSFDVEVLNNVVSYQATIQTIYGTGALNG